MHTITSAAAKRHLGPIKTQIQKAYITADELVDIKQKYKMQIYHLF